MAQTAHLLMPGLMCMLNHQRPGDQQGGGGDWVGIRIITQEAAVHYSIKIS